MFKNTSIFAKIASIFIVLLASTAFFQEAFALDTRHLVSPGSAVRVQRDLIRRAPRYNPRDKCRSFWCLIDKQKPVKSCTQGNTAVKECSWLKGCVTTPCDGDSYCISPATGLVEEASCVVPDAVDDSTCSDSKNIKVCLTIDEGEFCFPEPCPVSEPYCKNGQCQANAPVCADLDGTKLIDSVSADGSIVKILSSLDVSIWEASQIAVGGTFESDVCKGSQFLIEKLCYNDKPDFIAINCGDHDAVCVEGRCCPTSECEDLCADVPGIQTTFPFDNDGDGVTESCVAIDDLCPDIAGVQTTFLFDNDGDGTPESCVEDKCPEVEGIQETYLFDSDEDGELDQCDRCPGVDGLQMEYLYDSDGDGENDTCLPDLCPAIEGYQTKYPIDTVAGTCDPVVKDMAAGVHSACFLLLDGTVRCAGNKYCTNFSLYDLGQSSSVEWSKYLEYSKYEGPPTPIQGFDAEVVSLNAGGAGLHFCAVLSNGKVNCWGCNDRGALGDGSFINSAVPVEVVGLNNVAKVVTGYWKTFAMLKNGEIWGWGMPSSGDPYNCNGFCLPFWDGIKTTPQPVMAGFETIGWKDLSLGSDHLCLHMSDGLVRCWGLAANNVSYFDVTPTYISGTDKIYLWPEIPPAIPNLTNITTVANSADSFFACAIQDEKLYCWGDNNFAEIGNVETFGENVIEPVLLPTLEDDKVVDAFISNDFHSCAILTDGSVKCWYWDDPAATKPPFNFIFPANVVKIIILEYIHYRYALLEDGSVWVFRQKNNIFNTPLKWGSSSD